MDHRQKRNSRWSFHRVCTGAPQGCVLSPLFFCLHTNNCMSLHTTYPGPGLAGPVVRSQQPGANPTTNDPRPLQYTQQHYVSWWTIFQDLKWDSYIKKTQQKMNFLHQLRKFNLPQELPIHAAGYQFQASHQPGPIHVQSQETSRKNHCRSLTSWSNFCLVVGATLFPKTGPASPLSLSHLLKSIIHHCHAYV